MTKMRRLDRMVTMSNAKTIMSVREKNSVINVVALKRLQSRSYFESLERELLCKAKDGLNPVPVYNQLSSSIERNLNGWNGFLALLMATWFFVDLIVELGARRWITRRQEKQYVQNIFVNFYVLIRKPKWNLLREEDWSSLDRYINSLKRGSSTISTVLLTSGLIFLSLLNVRHPSMHGHFIELDLFSL